MGRPRVWALLAPVRVEVNMACSRKKYTTITYIYVHQILYVSYITFIHSLYKGVSLDFLSFTSLKFQRL